MNDKELLEMAAKAAELKHPIYTNTDGNGRIRFHYEDGDKRIQRRPWNPGDDGWFQREDWSPLEDDGDAFRLSIKLEADVNFSLESVQVYVCQTMDRPSVVVEEPFGDDPYAATRRAIVRAAAEIGRGMP